MHEYYIIHCTHNHVSHILYMYVIIQVNPIKDWVHRPRHCISFDSTLLETDCQLYFCSMSRLRISTILLELSFTRILPLTVQQSVIFRCRFSWRVANASFDRFAVKSSLTNIGLSRRSVLCGFKDVRARKTRSRTRSLEKRTITGRVCRSSRLFPSRCDLSRSCGDRGGRNAIVSLITANIFSSTFSPLPVSVIPVKMRLARREYCSVWSAWSSSSPTRLSSCSMRVLLSVSWASSRSIWAVCWSSLSARTWGYNAFFSLLTTASSLSNAMMRSARASSSILPETSASVVLREFRLGPIVCV